MNDSRGPAQLRIGPQARSWLHAGNPGAGDLTVGTPSAVDLHPCAGNNVVNLFDVFAVLDAITGMDPCCGQ